MRLLRRQDSGERLNRGRQWLVHCLVLSRSRDACACNGGHLICRPEDFIVTELDMAGHLVTLSGAGGLHQTGTMGDAPPGGVGPHTDLQQSTLLQHEAAASPPPACDETPSDIVVSQLPEVTDHTPQLCELVNDEAYQQVVSMATRCSTTPTAASASSLSLGEKHYRPPNAT